MHATGSPFVLVQSLMSSACVCSIKLLRACRVQIMLSNGAQLLGVLCVLALAQPLLVLVLLPLGLVAPLLQVPVHAAMMPASCLVDPALQWTPLACNDCMRMLADVSDAQRMYARSAREVRRLTAVARSPVYR